MSFNINDFRAGGLIYGGARPSQFEVSIFPVNSPTAAAGGLDGTPFASTTPKRIKFFVQAASLPAFIIGQAPVPYFGAVIKYAGERQYTDWQVTIMNDEDFAVRAFLEKWSNMMNALVSNRLDPEVYPTRYKSTAEVIQFGKDGSVVRAYTFHGLFPTVIDPIDLNWGDVNRIETYNVTFSLDYFEPTVQGTFNNSDVYSALLDDDETGAISGQQNQQRRNF